MVERQVITTWYTPDQKLPPEDIFVVATISGKLGNVTYDHALTLATWYEDEGWVIDGLLAEPNGFIVHAWCDLEPYQG